MELDLKKNEELLDLYEEELVGQYESFKANLEFVNELRKEILRRMNLAKRSS